MESLFCVEIVNNKCVYTSNCPIIRKLDIFAGDYENASLTKLI